MPDKGVDRIHLPVRRPAFAGQTKRTLEGSVPDWDRASHVQPPEGAPNVLLVLIDNTGFGNPRPFGGPIQTPSYTRPPTVPVGQDTTGEQQRSQRQGVGINDPLELAEAGVHPALDIGDGDGDDRDV
jgi:hypothetical protein